MQMNDFLYHIHQFKDSLYRFSLRIVGRTDEAEDVVQEVFIKAWEKQEDYSSIQNTEAFLVRMTKNLSIDKLRSKHRRAEQLGDEVMKLGTTATPEKNAEVTDTIERMEDIVAGLPEKQKMVFQLREIEGKSYQEIADCLDISMDQVKVNVFRARKTIKEKLLKADAYGL